MTDAMRARVLELVTAELTQHAKSRDPEVRKFGETCLRCIEDAELQVAREASGETELRMPLLRFFGTTDPELLAEVWGEQARESDARKASASPIVRDEPPARWSVSELRLAATALRAYKSRTCECGHARGLHRAHDYLDIWYGCGDLECTCSEYNPAFAHLIERPAVVSPSGVGATPDECAANSTGHSFGPWAPGGKRQCEWCGASPVSAEASRTTLVDSVLARIQQYREGPDLAEHEGEEQAAWRCIDDIETLARSVASLGTTPTGSVC